MPGKIHAKAQGQAFTPCGRKDGQAAKTVARQVLRGEVSIDTICRCCDRAVQDAMDSVLVTITHRR